MFIYGGFIFLYVYAFTELLDRNPNSWIWELAKVFFGVGIIYYYGDWFGISKYVPSANYIIIAYLLASFFATLYFVVRDKGDKS